MCSVSARYQLGVHFTRGFTLIEILTALVVMSVGLLGIAALQLTSLRVNHDALMRSQATQLAYEIIDRMRANRDLAQETGAYDVAFGAVPSGSSVAENDVRRWKQHLAIMLPSGDGSIARTGAGTTTRFTVVIQWDDSRGAEPPTSFAMETQI